MKARIQPVPFEQWPAELTSFVSAVGSSPGADQAPRSEAAKKGRNALGVLAYHPRLAKAWLQVTAHLMRGTSLTERQRELLILRVAVLRKSHYQWVQHVPIARRCGLGDIDIARIAYGPDAPFWDSLDRVMIRSVDELLADGVISDRMWSVVAEQFDRAQLLDLVSIVGAYETNTWMARSFGVELDEKVSSR